MLWLVNGPCQTSMSARVIFEWLRISPGQGASQLLITTRLAGNVGHGFSYFVCYVEHQLMPFGCLYYTQRICPPLCPPSLLIGVLVVLA